MKRLFWIFALLFFFSCKKNDDPNAIRLQRTESIDYSGNVLHAEYNYDNQGRLTSIRQNKNQEQPKVAVTINYNGNDAMLLSSPDLDPSYTQTTEVRLTLDAEGKLLKRMEYTHRISTLSLPDPAQEFRYDTLVCEYDASGLLKKTIGSRRDSIWIQSNYTMKKLFISTTNYTNNGGNVIAQDQYYSYPYTTTQNGVTTFSGGSSEYHQVFHYSRAFPNQADFKNAAVLNEYRQYYDPPLNNHYKNLPDKVTINNIDRDLSGTVIFTGNGAVDIDRTYDNKGFLSTVNIPSNNTHYRKFNYFYSRR